MLGVDPERALKAANRKFRRRFAHVEDAAARARAARPAESTSSEMDALWDGSEGARAHVSAGADALGPHRGGARARWPPACAAGARSALDSESDSLTTTARRSAWSSSPPRRARRWLIDPLAVRDLSPLAPLIADPRRAQGAARRRLRRDHAEARLRLRVRRPLRHHDRGALPRPARGRPAGRAPQSELGVALSQGQPEGRLVAPAADAHAGALRARRRAPPAARCTSGSPTKLREQGRLAWVQEECDGGGRAGGRAPRARSRRLAAREGHRAQLPPRAQAVAARAARVARGGGRGDGRARLQDPQQRDPARAGAATRRATRPPLRRVRAACPRWPRQARRRCWRRSARALALARRPSCRWPPSPRPPVGAAGDQARASTRCARGARRRPRAWPSTSRSCCRSGCWSAWPRRAPRRSTTWSRSTACAAGGCRPWANLCSPPWPEPGFHGRIRAFLPLKGPDPMKTSLAAVSAFALAASTAQAALPPNFFDELVTSVGAPTALAFTPDGRMLITRQTGTLRVFTGTTLLPTPAITFDSSVICTNFERGLLGVAVDPDFDTNNFIYLFYTHRVDATSCNSSTTPRNRVSRFTLPASNVINPATEVVLIDNMPSTNGNHNAGDVQFGRDGLLYVSVGDGGCDYVSGGGCGGSNDASRDQHMLHRQDPARHARRRHPGRQPVPGRGHRALQRDGRHHAGQPVPGDLRVGPAQPLPHRVRPQRRRHALLHQRRRPERPAEEIDLGQAGADYGWNCREGSVTNNTSGPCNPTPPGMVDPDLRVRARRADPRHHQPRQLQRHHRRRVRTQRPLARATTAPTSSATTSAAGSCSSRPRAALHRGRLRDQPGRGAAPCTLHVRAARRQPGALLHDLRGRRADPPDLLRPDGQQPADRRGGGHAARRARRRWP